jgi:4-hydroxythreonine-4-phosphate dehydrogenase
LPTKKETLNIGITIGDPAGIGPEVALKALAELRESHLRFVLIGREKVLEVLYKDMLPEYITASGIFISEQSGGLPLIYNVECDYPLPKPGQANALTGAESKLYIDAARELWKAGHIDAIVTGPVHKGFIEKSGTPFIGHTEYMADYIGEKFPLMMMFSPKYRVLLATTHVPLASAASLVTKERLVQVISSGFESIKAIDGKDVKIAVTGFDPHCGDDGAIGDFDIKVTAKAVEEARERGIPVDGPFSADTLFMPEKWQAYNLVIAHYHDQGLIPFKMLAFDVGVNVTLGLSLIRTSVDHGTALDIAGKGIAKHGSMVEAVKLAAALAGSA